MRRLPVQLAGSSLALISVLFLAGPARAQYSENVLYNFSGPPDAASPLNNLTADSSGNLYGTAASGGAYNAGAIFALMPTTGGVGPWTETVLYSFCPAAGCADGRSPATGVILDSHGNLFGAASGGGQGFGAIFELSRAPAGGCASGSNTGNGWCETVIYSFCPNGGTSGCLDGGTPAGSLLIDSSGNLYGTTDADGAGESGVVYELRPPVSGSGLWTESVLFSFNGTDGNHSASGLTMDSAGNIDGVTLAGGLAADGSVFELSPLPSGGSCPTGSNPGNGWCQSVLYNFCSVSGCSDGAAPYQVKLILDSTGNLYGTTLEGGSANQGVVFELSPAPGGGCPSGTNPGNNWCENVVHTFGGSPDGQNPLAALVSDSAGNFYGMTSQGGANGDGVVYELSPPANGSGAWTENILSTFGGANGADGYSSMTFDSHGNLYGTTFQGGASNNGVFFELSPPAPAMVVTASQSPAVYGESVYFIATVTTGNPVGNGAYASGAVQFQIDGSNFGPPVTLAAGAATSQSISTLTGNTITAIYSGDFYDSSTSARLVEIVNPANTTVAVVLTSGHNPSTYGSSLTITATVSGQYGQVVKRSKGAQPQVVTGSVTWSANTGCGATALVSGVAMCTTSSLPPGGDTVTATYGGDSEHDQNTGSLGQTVNRQTPAVTVTLVNPSSEPYGTGTAVVVTATVTWTGGGSVPSGTVTFGSTAAGSFAGSASCSLSRATTDTCTQTFTHSAADAAGSYTLSASIAADANYNQSSSTQINNFTITPVKATPTVTMTIVLPNSEPYGTSVGAAVTATLNWAGSGPAPTAKGALLSFTSTAAGTSVPVVCLGNTSPIICGTLFLPVVNDPAGVYTITASYAGDSNYNAASSPQTNNFSITTDTPAVKLTPNPASVYNGSTAPVTLTALFTGVGGYDAAPNGAVTFSAATGGFSGQSCNTSGDTLTCTVSYKPSGKVAAGTYSNYITASIAPAGDYKAGAGFANLTVTK